MGNMLRKPPTFSMQVYRMSSTHAELTLLLQSRLQSLLSARQHPKTICPSEVPRSLNSVELAGASIASWRELMDEVRDMVWEARDRGEVEIMQRGLVLANDVRREDVSGPIRVRKRLWTEST